MRIISVGFCAATTRELVVWGGWWAARQCVPWKADQRFHPNSHSLLGPVLGP